jgi:aryl-alcohol dehydrogenase-like predicted oxidoreductase
MKMTRYKNSELSSLCLGTVQLGMPYGIANSHGQPSKTEAYAILDTALRHNVNTFDTAQAYQNSENVLGDYQSAHPTHTMHIISKISSVQFSAEAEKSVRISLRQLQSDTLFALLLHDSQALKHWSNKEEKILTQLKNKDMIKHFGVSIYNEEEFLVAVNNPSIDIIQIPFNLFDRRALEGRWFEKAHEANKLIFIRSVYLQGLFFMSADHLPKKLESAAPFLRKLEHLAKELNTDILELALSFVRSAAPDAIIILGCETEAQLRENISLFNGCKTLNQNTLNIICDEITQVPNTLYNPALWNK